VGAEGESAGCGRIELRCCNLCGLVLLILALGPSSPPFQLLSAEAMRQISLIFRIFSETAVVYLHLLTTPGG